MTEEEINALQEAKEAAEKRAADAEALAIQARADAEKAKTDLTNVVEEVKNLRLKNAEALNKANLSNDGLDVNALIEQALQSREQQSREASFKEALAEFKAAKPEFQADAAGLVYAKFESGLTRFNFADIQNKEQMKSRLEEVYRFQNQQSSREEGTDYEGMPSNATPIGQAPASQSRDMKSVLEQTGMDEAKYNSLKTKYPDAFGSLGLA